MFIAESLTSAVVFYLLMSFFISLLFFRAGWKGGEGHKDTHTTQEQKHSAITASLLLGLVWPVSASIYLICVVVVVVVQGLLFVSGKLTGGETK